LVFPPLCLPAASEKTDIDAVLGRDGAELIEGGSKYEIRFKIVEVIESIKEKFRS